MEKVYYWVYTKTDKEQHAIGYTTIIKMTWGEGVEKGGLSYSCRNSDRE